MTEPRSSRWPAIRSLRASCPWRAAWHRLACALGLHAPRFWYAPTGRASAPLYEPRTECMWCLRRFA